MMESERAMQELVISVLGLAEATRLTATGEEQDLGRLEDLAERADAVARQVACLRALAQSGTTAMSVEPAGPLPRSEDIVESLDDIFGGL